MPSELVKKLGDGIKKGATGRAGGFETGGAIPAEEGCIDNKIDTKL
jgi:hypothetical protein